MRGSLRGGHGREQMAPLLAKQGGEYSDDYAANCRNT